MSEHEPTSAIPIDNNGCGHQLTWIGASFVLPLASPGFYQQAARRPTRWALAFYTLLISIITLLTILGNSRDLYAAQRQLLTLAAENGFPVITIQDGQTSATGTQPFTILDEETALFVIDTTGQLTEIDQDKYISGVLLTTDELHILNLFEYRKLDLDELHTMLGQNPIVLDQTWFEEALAGLTSIFFVLFTIVLLIWNFVFRSIYMLMLAWMIYTTTLIFNRTSAIHFKKTLAMGLYASLPAMVFYYLFTLIGIYTPFLQSFLLLAFWGVALYLSERDPNEAAEMPQITKIWLVPLGVPMLLALALNVVYHWSEASTPLSLLTVATIGLIAYLDSRPLPSALPPATD